MRMEIVDKNIQFEKYDTLLSDLNDKMKNVNECITTRPNTQTMQTKQKSALRSKDLSESKQQVQKTDTDLD